MKTVMLGDLLTEQQLETTKQLMDVSKTQGEARESLEIYYRMYSKELEQKGVDATYLSYMVAFKLYSLA